MKPDFLFAKFLCCVLLFVSSCRAQTNRQATQQGTPANRVVGGPFENGDFLYIGMPEQINSTDTSPGWNQNGQHLLITGTIFKRDGKTPAPGVILYYYHTDINGLYSDKVGLDKRVVRHGYIRGWVKSDSEGKYAIYTVRPGVYPNRGAPAHIHPAIKEPGIDKEYYIDEFVFDDDPLLTTGVREAMENRGGSGVLRTYQRGDLQVAEHNIILGLNIPNYPTKAALKINSGKEIGEDLASFTPYHAWGADSGTKTCPVCKYGKYQGILYFVGNKTDWPSIKQWLTNFERECFARQQGFNVFFVYGNEKGYSREKRLKELSDLGKELHLRKVALTFVPSFSDELSDVAHNKVNPEVGHTIIVFKRSNIIDKYIDLQPTPKNFLLVSKSLDATEGDLVSAAR